MAGPEFRLVDSKLGSLYGSLRFSRGEAVSLACVREPSAEADSVEKIGALLGSQRSDALVIMPTRALPKDIVDVFAQVDHIRLGQAAVCGFEFEADFHRVAQCVGIGTFLGVEGKDKTISPIISWGDRMKLEEAEGIETRADATWLTKMTGREVAFEGDVRAVFGSAFDVINEQATIFLAQRDCGIDLGPFCLASALATEIASIKLGQDCVSLRRPLSDVRSVPELFYRAAYSYSFEIFIIAWCNFCGKMGFPVPILEEKAISHCYFQDYTDLQLQWATMGLAGQSMFRVSQDPVTLQRGKPFSAE